MCYFWCEVRNPEDAMHQISSTAIIELAVDLTSSLNQKDRFDRLLDTVRKTINCDAVALLSFQNDVLTPLALQGLSRDTLGRRFHVSEHPRFTVLCRCPPWVNNLVIYLGGRGQQTKRPL